MEAFELIPAHTLEFKGSSSGSGLVVLLMLLLAGVVIWHVTRNK